MALTNKLTAIGDAIRAKTGKTDLISLDQMPVEIESIQGGGGGGATPSAKWNDVTFIDYDGAVLYSYSLEEVQSLTELPTLPTHDGLVCQGWNWTLESIKSFNYPVIVGAMYITDDGATRLHIRITTTGRMTVPLCINQTVSNGVSIDWGDGSVPNTLVGTGNRSINHTYSEPGDYVVSLMPEDECTLSLGPGKSSLCVMGSNENNGRVYCNMLRDVYIGKNVTSISAYAFQHCYSLASITIPDGVTSISTYAFQYCYSLASITIPNGVTSILGYAFSNCNSLASITIPAGVTSIKGNAFQFCSSLASITIPDGVTSIGNNAFQSCSSLASITIPDGVTSIGGTVFSNCYSLASVTIPDGVTSIGGTAFQNCNSLASITIPNGVTSISASAFQNCYSLASITIPGGVTSIKGNAFSNCYGICYYDFSACTAVPALSNTSAFSSIPSDCQMLIPSTLYDEWSAATNWVGYVNYMVAV